MAGLVAENLKVFESTYDDKNHTDINRLANALVTSGADIMSPIVTQAYGSMSDRFPLMLLTEGKNRMKPVKSLDGLYKVPIMGKPKKTSVVVRCDYTSTDKIGAGKSIFYITFADNWFARDHDIENSGRVGGKYLLKIVDNPERTQDGWKYPVRLEGGNKNRVVPLDQIQPGKKWGKQAASVGIAGSRGNASRNQAPAQFQNQTNFIRMSYNYSGNVQNKVMNIQLRLGSGKTTTYWADWESYMHQLQFREECENVLWYSSWNRDLNNLISDLDINSQEIITRGSGVLDQIPNNTTYSSMSAAKIQQIVQDVFYNSAPGVKKDIVLFTGIGGRRVFQQGMADANKGTLAVSTNNYYVRDPENDTTRLEYGAYFGSFVTQDGHRITIKTLDLLDKGAKAETCDKYNGLPVCSYDMYFLDMSEVEGEPNVQFVYEEGRKDIEKIIVGLTTPKGYADTVYAASDIDAASCQFAKSLGVYIKNPINCFTATLDVV